MPRNPGLPKQNPVKKVVNANTSTNITPNSRGAPAGMSPQQTRPAVVASSRRCKRQARTISKKQIRQNTVNSYGNMNGIATGSGSSRPRTKRSSSNSIIDKRLLRDVAKGQEAYQSILKYMQTQKLAELAAGTGVIVGNRSANVTFIDNCWAPRNASVYMPSAGPHSSALIEDPRVFRQTTPMHNDKRLFQAMFPSTDMGRLLRTYVSKPQLLRWDPRKPPRPAKFLLRRRLDALWRVLLGLRSTQRSLKELGRRVTELLMNLAEHFDTNAIAINVNPEDEMPLILIIDGDEASPYSGSRSGTSNSSDSGGRQVGWQNCTAMILFDNDSDLVDNSLNPKCQEKLATYAKKIISMQPNRRFLTSLVITEYALGCQKWDRAGGVYSPCIQYVNKGPQGEDRVLRNGQIYMWEAFHCLVGWKRDLQGLEDAIIYGPEGLVLTAFPPTYTITSPWVEGSDFVFQDCIFSSYTLSGRGSSCWLARSDDTHWLLIDAWSWVDEDVAAKRETLWNSLRRIRATPATGLLRFECTNKVRIKRTGAADLAYDNRRRGATVGRDTRLVHLREYWQRADDSQLFPLALATNVKDILIACRDAAKALEFLYRKAKIVHRDITLWNIAWGRSGGRTKGFLLDFSCAAVLSEQHTCDPRKDQTPGAQVFMSVNALGGYNSTPFDDFESLSYLLWWIFGTHTDLPLSSFIVGASKLPSSLLKWSTFTNPTKLASNKHKFFEQPREQTQCDVTIQDGFSELDSFMKQLRHDNTRLL